MMRRLILVAALLAAPAGATPSEWILQGSPGPRIRFTVEAPLDDIHGVSAAVTGALVLDAGAWASATGRLRASLSAFSTGIALRDEDLRDQFFQVGRFADATLTVQSLERVSVAALVPGREAQADAVGTLSLHGRERSVRVPITVLLSESVSGRGLRIHGELAVAFRDYDIPRPARLFLKLGDLAKVSVDATFRARAAPAPVAARPEPMPAAVPVEGSFPLVARRPRLKPKVSPAPFEFAFTSPEGRGERLMRDPSVGAAGNALSCWSCHSTRDERTAFLDAAGHVRPDASLWDSARRPTFWRGLAATPQQAANICVKMFMLKWRGANAEQLADLAAYLRRISPDAAAPHDYKPLWLTRTTAIDRPTGGDAARGAVLTERFCAGCHAESAVRPPLTPGLYEADDLVRRVRWIAGHDARQMPPMTLDRLRDAELRDVVTYLVGDPSERIFQRKTRDRHDSIAAKRPAGQTGWPR